MSYLPPAHRDALKRQADVFRNTATFDERVRFRAELSKNFRQFIEEIGILDDAELSRVALARIVEQVWKIQNLQAMTLPRLLGTYTYHKHFKNFSGDEAAFAQHMGERFPNWKKGDIGYPGVDTIEFGKAIARAVSADEANLGPAIHSLLSFGGAGRALITGILVLYDPTRFALVNTGAIGAFDKGMFGLNKAEQAELRSAAVVRFGIPESSGYLSTRKLLGWQLLLEELRSELETENYLGLDWLLWRVASDQGPGGPGGIVDEDVLDPDFIQKILMDVPKVQNETRDKALSDAKALLDERIGNLTADDITTLFRYWSTDYYNEKLRFNRFSLAFRGMQRQQVVSSLRAANEWMERLWKAPEEDIPTVLDQFWKADEVMGAGVSLPTMLLHTRMPSRWFPFMSATRSGYTRLTGEKVAKGRKSVFYLQFVDGVRELAETHSIPSSLIDLVLSTAAASSSGGKQPDKKKGKFKGFTADTFSFLDEFKTNNTSTWYDTQKDRFRNSVRQPLRHLVADLGTTFIEKVAPDLEHEPKSPNTMSNIRKNIWGKKADGAYWHHYWAAFHRPELRKNEDFQLYIFLAPDICAFGMYTGSASSDDIARFKVRIREHEDLVDSVLSKTEQMGITIRASKTDSPEDAVHQPKGSAGLADLLDEQIVLRREMTPEQATDRGPALLYDVAEVFTALYPLYALATVDDPSTIDWGHPTHENGDSSSDPDYTKEDFLEETLLDSGELDQMLDLLDDKPQLILYGPPGTGKTWIAERLGRLLCEDDTQCRIVQFHPSYGYEDFIEGIRPTVDPETSQLRYDVVPGIFRVFCDEARKRPQQKHVLIIDEINRGNLPRIFGELLYLLERRGKRIQLAVSGTQFSVPANLLVIGTMNTADQSIALVDTALRRRFHFKELVPDASLLERWLDDQNHEFLWVAKLLTSLNDKLVELGIDSNLAIGHSHFMDANLTEQKLERVWEHSIYPTLQEYFYGQQDKLGQFRYEDFVSKLDIDTLSDDDTFEGGVE